MNKKGLFYYDIIAILLSVCLLMMVITGNRLFFYLLLGGSIIFLTKPDVILPVYFVASLATSYFDIGGFGVSAGRYLSILFLLSLILYVLRYGLYLTQKSNMLIWTLILIALTFISGVIGYSGDLTISLQMVMNILLFFLLPQVKKMDYNRLLLRLVISYALLTIVVFVQAVNNEAFLFTERYTSGEDELNANRIAMMVEQCAAILLAVIFMTNNMLVRLVSIFLFFLALFVVVATASRSALIAVLAALCFCIYFSFKNRNRLLFIPVLLVSVGLYFMLNYLQGLSTTLLDRFTLREIQDTGGAGRIDSMKIIINNIFPSHLWFGSGMGGRNMKALGESYNLPNLAHNIVIDPLSQMGLLVYPFFCYYLYKCLLKPFRYLKSNGSFYYLFVPLSLFVASLFNGFGETIFYEKLFWNNMALALLACNHYDLRLLQETKSDVNMLNSV